MMTRVRIDFPKIFASFSRSSAIFLNLKRVFPINTTLKPSLAKYLALALPIPSVAPVTIAQEPIP